MKKSLSFALLVSSLATSHIARAWDYEGHRWVNQLALVSLPANFPQFVQTPSAKDRIVFLAGEADRWRNSPDLALNHINKPDHYIDIEELALYGLKPESLPPLRCDFVGALTRVRAAHPEKFPAIDAERDADHTRQLVGLLPWAITENYGKLKSGFSYLKAFRENGGTPEEIANAEANIVYIMGVMGHYVGDSAQPLHTTENFNGWAAANPHRYTTNKTFHSWIDGRYFEKVGGADFKTMEKNIRPAQLVSSNGQSVRPEQMFSAVVHFITEQNKLVEPLYEMEKEGKLSGNGTVGLQGKAFLEGQLVKAGQMLGDIWYSAWQQAPPDNYLKGQLAKRKLGNGAANGIAKP